MLKKTKLNYMNAVPNTPPVATKKISSSAMDKVDREIREKVDDRKNINPPIEEGLYYM